MYRLPSADWYSRPTHTVILLVEELVSAGTGAGLACAPPLAAAPSMARLAVALLAVALEPALEASATTAASSVGGNTCTSVPVSLAASVPALASVEALDGWMGSDTGVMWAHPGDHPDVDGYGAAALALAFAFASAAAAYRSLPVPDPASAAAEGGGGG